MRVMERCKEKKELKKQKLTQGVTISLLLLSSIPTLQSQNYITYDSLGQSSRTCKENNRRFPICDVIREPNESQHLLNKIKRVYNKVQYLLDRVGLVEATTIQNYKHAFLSKHPASISKKT